MSEPKQLIRKHTDMEQIKYWVENGMALSRIAKLTNNSLIKIKEIVESNELSLVKETFSDDKIAHICKLYSEGVSAKQLSIKYSIDKRRVLKWVQKTGNLRNKNDSHRVTEFRQDIFDSVDSPEKAYWLGFFYADAYNGDELNNTVSIYLKGEDYGHLVKLAKFFGLPDSKVTRKINNAGYDVTGLKLYSKHLCKRLAELGCTRAKSFTVQYPIWLNSNLHNHFIRGLFDGDGCLTFRAKHREWKWSLVSTDVCCDSMVKVLDERANVSIKHHNISKTNNNTSLLETSGNEKIARLMTWLYQGAEEKIWLDRKREKYLSLIDMQAGRRR